MEPARYLERYVAPLASITRAKGIDIPDLDPRHFEAAPAELEPAPLSLSQLFAAGALCGHAEARAELARRIGDLDRNPAHEALAVDLLQAQRELTALRTSVRVLEQGAAAAGARAREIESSTTWRMTAPVRAAGHRMKVGAAALATQWRTARQWPRYVGTARDDPAQRRCACARRAGARKASCDARDSGLRKRLPIGWKAPSRR